MCTGDLGQVDTADADQGQHKCGQKVQSGSMPLQVGSKNFAEFTMMIHGTTSGGAVPIFISSYVLLASFVVYLAQQDTPSPARSQNQNLRIHHLAT